MSVAMARRSASVCLRMLLCLLLSAAAAVPMRAASIASASPVPLLWRVQGEGQTVWLLGSFHMLAASDYPLSPDVDAAFAAARRVMFELPPDEVESAALRSKMLQAASLGDGRSLQDQIDPAMWKRLGDWCADHGVPLSSLARHAPWFVALSIDGMAMNRQGLRPELGLDRHFMAAAARAGKPVAGLEAVREQIALLAGMGRAEQVQMLDEALDQSGAGDAETRELHAAWRRGDADALWNDMAGKMRHEYPALYRRINVERNDRWLPRIEQRLHDRQGDTLVIVGSLHLLGSDGVVEKLRARGYAVRRVCGVCDADEANGAARAP